MWLLVVARANEAEGYGVDLELKSFVKRGDPETDRIKLYLFMEEQYHSRMLVEACRSLDVDIELQKPRAIMRFFIHAMQHLPRSIRYVPIVCGEVVGCAVFRRLAEMSETLRDEPEVADRLRLLFREPDRSAPVLQ